MMDIFIPKTFTPVTFIKGSYFRVSGNKKEGAVLNEIYFLIAEDKTGFRKSHPHDFTDKAKFDRFFAYAKRAEMCFDSWLDIEPREYSAAWETLKKPSGLTSKNN